LCRYKGMSLQLLTELEDFLRILDKENLSSTAVVKKSFLSDLLRVYTKSSGTWRENWAQGDGLPNGDVGVHSSPPQKSLPDLPPPKIPETKQPLVPKIESPEGYYEEAEPYDISVNEDGDAVSSSYESYDEEESSKGKSATHQWPSTEATIELMKDARICAFLWRKKWLGQWAKQLCVIKDTRLLCYKSSKDHSPQLDVNLLGCTVIHKEKQVKKKEHKLKIIPANADVIVLGLQSKDQAEQWLRVIQETSGLQSEGGSEGNQYIPDSQQLMCASESGSSTDGHPETTEAKDVKKKGTTGLKLSNLMNLGRKKSSSMDSPERSLETSSYLNVLVNSQWKSRWCHVKDGHLHFYQDKNRSKLAQQPLSLAGCEIIPEPIPDHLYSFHILKLPLQHVMIYLSGSKTDPEEFTYDYVDADRVSCIVSAAKNSFFLMQRKYSEPNTYIDNLPKGRTQQEELYDDVDLPDVHGVRSTEDSRDHDRVYLDLTPVKSFLHCAGKQSCQLSPRSSPSLERAANRGLTDTVPETALVAKEDEPSRKTVEISEQVLPEKAEPEELPPRTSTIKIQTEQQKIAFPQLCPLNLVCVCTTLASENIFLLRLSLFLWTVFAAAAVETKLGKNRTEAEVKRFTEEKERLEKEKDEIRAQLTQLRKERRELKEVHLKCEEPNKSLEQRLKEIEEECKKKESRRVDLELSLVEVKENLKKAESGPVTLGTAVDTTHLDNAAPKVGGGRTSHLNSPVNSATALKNRPLSVMVTGKGTVLQKAKEWEKKGAS
uniref:Actin filament associated protein 1 like 2 n=1 Tax=Nothoprocta perdicaria TaxID=30464 RepID=A0A8C6ZS46_NOTPE